MSRRPKAAPLAHSVSDGLVGLRPSSLSKGKFPAVSQIMAQLGTTQEREEFMYEILSAMPRSQLSSLQRRIAPLLQFDVVGSLPTEVALQIFSHLPAQTLLTCTLVSRRWNVLANEPSLWKTLCHARGWEWRQPMRLSHLDKGAMAHSAAGVHHMENDDEGMGDSDDEGSNTAATAAADTTLTRTEGLSFMTNEMDSGFASISMIQTPAQGSSSTTAATTSGTTRRETTAFFQHLQPLQPGSKQMQRTRSAQDRHSAPATFDPTLFLKPNYKLLYRTHTHLRNRFLSSNYRLSVIQTRGTPANGHMNMIYCVQLYTYPSTNRQVIFTGSRDKTIRQWNLKTGAVERVLEGVHTESVLSLCVRDGYLASAGSDWKVVVWHLATGKAIKVLKDHADSVLCVRFDDKRLVSCSKDRTVRVYSFPDMQLQHVLGGHRAAVNAVSLSGNLVVSGSGDRSMNVWNVETGKLVHTFEDHHIRGIASIDFKPPYIVSGSSDKHIRLVDMNTSQGWSTSPEYDTAPLGLGVNASLPLSILNTSAHNAHMTHVPTLTQPIHNGTGGHNNPAAVGFVQCTCQSCGSTALQPITYSSSPYASPPSISNANSFDSLNTTTTNVVHNPSPPTFLPYSLSQHPTHHHHHHPHPHHHHHHHPQIHRRGAHADLVRSVSLGPDFVVTGSYDLSVKVWERQSGALVADLTGGHTGKIFCVAADRTKVVSCGEDLRICVWDFGVGIETGFLKTEY